MTLNDYQEAARHTQNTNLSRDEQERHALYGLAAEVGEIHGLFQKQYQGHPISATNLADELGDLLWFLAELADARGVSLDWIAKRNISKLRARYPRGFDPERSVHRD